MRGINQTLVFSGLQAKSNKSNPFYDNIYMYVYIELLVKMSSRHEILIYVSLVRMLVFIYKPFIFNSFSVSKI